eukprot:2430078-Prymnesium_polylepis.1
MYAARDPLGIKPLFYGTSPQGDTWFASEVNPLCGICVDIQAVPPGHYWHRGELIPYFTAPWVP